MINTIIFDIGNVLVDFRWRYAIDMMNLDDKTADRVAKATVLSPMWNEYDRGIMTDDELLEGFVANDCEIGDVTRTFIEDYYKYIVKQFDYAHDWIDDLKSKGYKVYFLSNFSKRGHEVFAKDLDFLDKGDGAVLSYAVKLIKPDSEIYEYILNTYNINADEAVFIDDSKANIDAAREVGINTILFTDRESVLKELKALGVE